MCVGDQVSWMSDRWRTGLLVLAMSAAASPSVAGPPYVTDDPEPTYLGHWENYLYTETTRVAGQTVRPEAGIEINYGAFADTQLTWSLPLTPNPGPGGIGVVWAPLGGGVKYRLIQEDDNGWRPQVAFFPQVLGPGRAGQSRRTGYGTLSDLDAEILW
jgi:hypothetical protein